MAHDVGIVAMDVAFPDRFVSQAQLESHDGVSPGKYTIGLGQEQMAFVGPSQDINSMCLNAVDRLFSAHGVCARDIGRLEVGTETLVDKSKSTKTELMALFKENPHVEGVTTINACYGGTAALFNSLDWLESSAWDGRYALVVCGDIAIYEKGPARPTGGAGVVAMLLGRHAPIVINSETRATYMENVYDFYKPNLSSEYPIVDGKLSNECYLRSIDNCYAKFAQNHQRVTGKKFDLSSLQHSLFHLPYAKLVQKSYARFSLCDGLARGDVPDEVQEALDVAENKLTDRALDKLLSTRTAETYATKVFPGTLAGRRLGNLYAGSVYAGLCSLVEDLNVGDDISIFSYGSGSASSLFTATVKRDVSDMAARIDFKRRLDARTEASPREFEAALAAREAFNLTKVGPPVDPLDSSRFRLGSVDALGRRAYVDARATTRAPSASAVRALHTLARRIVK